MSSFSCPDSLGTQNWWVLWKHILFLCDHKLKEKLNQNYFWQISWVRTISSIWEKGWPTEAELDRVKSINFICLIKQTWAVFLAKGSGQTILAAAATAAKSLQSCPTLCDPIDGSPPVSPIPGILQTRILEWVAISFSNAWKWKVKVKSLSHVQLLATPWTSAYQAPPSMGFSRQEYWSGVPLPSLRVYLDKTQIQVSNSQLSLHYI